MITVSRDTFPLARTFTISRGSKTEAQVLTVRVTRGGVTGWGECVPYARYGSTLDSDTRPDHGAAGGHHAGRAAIGPAARLGPQCGGLRVVGS